MHVSCVQHCDTCGLNDTGFLWLVNKENRLPADFEPYPLSQHNGIVLHSAAHEAYKLLLTAMHSDGIYNLRLQSAYRCYGYQQKVYDQKVNELISKGYSKNEAEIAASKSVQPPGASEHQLGLALDVSIDGTLTKAFGETTAGKWLADNCHKYGFIIRYPFLKTDVTHIVYEPWHLRYVGIPHSMIMANMELALEEYLCYIEHAGIYMRWAEGNEYYLIKYVSGLSDIDCNLVLSASSLCFEDKNKAIITIHKRYPDTGYER